MSVAQEGDAPRDVTAALAADALGARPGSSMYDEGAGGTAALGAALGAALRDGRTRHSALKAVATALQQLMKPGTEEDVFSFFEDHGLHITPVHYYSPIPDMRSLSDEIWSRPSDLRGIDLNEDEQVHLLRDVFPQFAEECSDFATEPTGGPSEFYFGNNYFDGTDAAILYCMIRHLRPGRVLEVGSGFSTRLLAKALARNQGGSLVCVDPFPGEVVKAGFPGLNSLIIGRIQDIDLAEVTRLTSGDVLFIDSSHVTRIDGDVNFLFLEVLPSLNPGVVVHVHDIFLPDEYPKQWIMEHRRFWTEQYLLQAFLEFNDAFEVIMANQYLGRHQRELLTATFPTVPWWGGGSFWMRRK